MHVVICGGGVIGACVAYFLSRRGVLCTVIERYELACAASGKSGGFLALNWCDGTPLEALARRSFALHSDLAAGLAGDWGYRRLDAFSGSVSEEARPIENGAGASWLSASFSAGRAGAKAGETNMFESSTSGAAQLETFSEGSRCKANKKPNDAVARRSYSVVYDDDVDSWSVVSTPFDGLYFVGTKSRCDAFVTTLGISGLLLLQRN